MKNANEGIMDILMVKKINEIKKEFFKLFTSSYAGDSGLGGNDPQEPSCDWQDYPMEVWEWFEFHYKTLINDTVDRIKINKTGYIQHMSSKEGYDYGNGWDACVKKLESMKDKIKKENE